MNTVAFYKLVSGLSSALINISSYRLEVELGIWFKRLVEFLEVDSITAARFSADEQKFILFQEYSLPARRAVPPDKTIAMVPNPQRVKKRLLEGKALVVEHIPDDLTEEELNMAIVKAGAKSFVSVPLAARNRVLGVLVVSVFCQEMCWSEDLVLGIRLIGEIIANALLRQVAQTELRAEIEWRRRLESRYITILKTANVGFIIVDLNTNRIIEANDMVCAMTGYVRNELLQKKINDIDWLYSDEDITGIRQKMLAHGALNHVTQHRRKDGKIIDVAVSSNLLAQEGIVFSFLRDITDLKRAREEINEQLKFETILAGFSAALINVSGSELAKALDEWMAKLARFLQVDRCSIMKYSENLTKRQTIQTYLHPNHIDRYHIEQTKQPAFNLYNLIKHENFLRINRIPDELPEAMDQVVKDRIIRDGTKSLFYMPLKTGAEVFGLILFASYTHENLWTDQLVRRLALVAEIVSNAVIRDRKDTELIKYREQLEQLVAQRTAQLKEAQDELVKSARLATLGKIAAAVSHELRNPLGTIRASLFSINHRLADPAPKVHASLNRAERNVQRCDRIIEELLDFTSDHDLQLVDTPVDAWLSEVLGDLPPPEGIALEKKLETGISIPIDQERFRRCLINLLTNAYQAIDQSTVSRNRGRVQVSARADNRSLEIHIADNGIGFDPDKQERLFEPLFSTKGFGVGLGMPIAKQIIEQHGGSIAITGHPGGGATVVLQMPLTPLEKR